MKKMLLITLSCLLCMSLAVPASANGWGLKGDVYDIVSETNRFDGYSAVADDGNAEYDARYTVNHAVLENRYHAVLIATVRKGDEWKSKTISTTAVFQPGDATKEEPKLVELLHESGSFSFVLKYDGKGPGGEHYTFCYDFDKDEYILREAYFVTADPMYDNNYIPDDKGMLFWSGGPDRTFLPIGDAMWLNDGITLEEFNIAQTPRSIAEIRNLNRTAQALALEGPEWVVRNQWKGVKGAGNLAVYSAPDERSWRAAEGKASVSLGGDVEVIGTADGWSLIQYEVSPRTSRIGWVKEELAKNETIAFAEVPLVTQADTFLTDDPFVSQYRHMEIPKGTELTGLTRAGEYYAYVETTNNGQLIRGFVPMKDLITKYDRVITTGTDRLMADVRWDVMDALTGKWFPANGYDEGKLMILFTDGGYRTRRVQDAGDYDPEGNFRVYDAAEGDGSTYELSFFTEDNREYSCLIRLNEDGTVTVTRDGQETVYDRNEYSSYGNG